MKTKTLGILGLGNQSTLFYIKELNAAFDMKNGDSSTYPFKLLNTNFDEINNLLPTPSKKLDGIVKYYIDELLKLNVNTLLIPNITLHETIDRLKIKSEIIHPIHTTIAEVQKKNHKKVILFGSSHTMVSNYIKSNFEKNEIEVLLPSKNDMKFVDNVRKQVYQETATKKILTNYNLIIKKYAQNNAVVIACTELSIALKNKNLKIFDMARIQTSHADLQFKICKRVVLL